MTERGDKHSLAGGAGGCCGHKVGRIAMARLERDGDGGFSRRTFLLGLGTAAIGHWAAREALASSRSTGGGADSPRPSRQPLTVQPVLTHAVPKPRKQTSWRSWGGLQTQEDAERELRVIADQLARMKRSEDWLKILPPVAVKDKAEAERVRGGEFDVLLIFGAGAGVDVFEALASPNRPTIIFVRHRTGPAYLWYEVVHPRFLRKTVDEFGQPGVDVRDVVVDKYSEVLWRLRALNGLRNAMGQKIVAIGNAGGWGAGGRKAPDNAREKFHIEIVPVSYEELDKRIKKARADSKRTAKAEADTRALLYRRGISLHCDRQFVVNALLLNDVFKDLMAENNTDAITVQACMGTIMPVTETTACLPLMLLNDEGYMAFCESDFVVIPSGILLHHISGLPVFLCNPTYPHEGVITVAHCTAPSKMDGHRHERTLIMTHFESDYGAAPKVELRKGQIITILDPDFGAKRWMGFRGKVVGSPYLDICRAQQDVAIEGNWEKLAEEMRGFHWMVCYGDYRKEVGYALKKAGIGWLDISEG